MCVYAALPATLTRQKAAADLTSIPSATPHQRPPKRPPAQRDVEAANKAKFEAQSEADDARASLGKLQAVADKLEATQAGAARELADAKARLEAEGAAAARLRESVEQLRAVRGQMRGRGLIWLL